MEHGASGTRGAGRSPIQKAKRTGQLIRTLASRGLILLCAIWAGVIIGVSFVSTPAKFLAPSLSMAVALDVGRHTFRVLSGVEFAMAVLASVLSWFSRSKPVISALAGVWVLLLVQRLWLLPVLDHRVALYLAGSEPVVSYHHTLFAGMEAVKILLLIACATSSIYRKV